MKNPIRTVTVRRRRRRRGTHYPNDLAQVLRELTNTRIMESGGWKARSIGSYRETMRNVANDSIFWEDVKELLNAANKLKHNLTY